VAAVPTQRQLCAADDMQRSDSRQDLTEEDPKAAAWSRSSSFKGSAAWLEPTSNRSLNLPAPAYALNLGLRLLLPSPVLTAGQVSECSHCGEQHVDERFHCLSCPRMQSFRITRHDLVRNTLAAALARVFGPRNVISEPWLHNLRADIEVRSVTGRFFIDTIIINPCCPSALRYRSAYTTEATAANAFRGKTIKYRPALAACGISESCFIPMVWEATGRLYSKSRQLLAERVDQSDFDADSNAEAHLEDDADADADPNRNGADPPVRDTMAYMLRRIATIIAIGNSTMAMAYRRRARRVDTAGAEAGARADDAAADALAEDDGSADVNADVVVDGAAGANMDVVVDADAHVANGVTDDTVTAAATATATATSSSSSSVP
jgi:hypothetical protein